MVIDILPAAGYFSFTIISVRRLEDERDTILLSWNLGPKVNSRNRPMVHRIETRLRLLVLTAKEKSVAQ